MYRGGYGSHRHDHYPGLGITTSRGGDSWDF